MIAISHDETNFPHKLLLTDGQVSNIRKAFANGFVTNIKLSKGQLPKVLQLGGFLFDSPIQPKITSKANPIKNNWYVKELKNPGNKKLFKIIKDILVDAELNIIGKKTKKGISMISCSGITVDGLK